ncbi:CHAD domain-containing protein [Lysobacter sp. A6]|uniref:CHAD domain-containing protein n=1 Tax=Noviluteimonas lactosilytica TaxID=2888523 RepID=A0ABS8JJS4_9GAMM|nr:CHAD domain-containing protein [Lysobacter lactosilyticus]MCC8363861.1 CHAD domain-containing protein [Lysobacter lactosilyticus]
MEALPAMPSPGPALREYAEAELADAIASLDAPRDGIHDAVHRARKAIRRTRAALSIAEPALGPGARLVDRALRRMNKRSSWQRDAHALVQTLDRLRDRPQPRDTHALLCQARDVAAARRKMLAREARFAETVDTTRAEAAVIRAALAGLAWQSLEAHHIDAAIAATSRKADKARERARRSDDAEDWHRWRRCMRRRSQQFRAAAAAGFDAAMPGVDKSIAEQLGLMQDLSLVIAHCGDSGGFDDAGFDHSVRKALRRYAERALERQRKRLRSVLPGA